MKRTKVTNEEKKDKVEIVEIEWEHEGNEVDVCGPLHDFAYNTMKKTGNKWTLKLELLPGIYLYDFEVDGTDIVHDSNKPYVKVGGQRFNVVCVGSRYSLNMVYHLYRVLSKLSEKDCEKEVDSFFKTFPTFPIDLPVYYGDDEKDGRGTFLHWACIYKREKIVSLLVSKNANLFLPFRDFYDDRDYITFDNKNPIQIATRMNDQKIIDIFLRVNWPKTHKILQRPLQRCIEETMVCLKTMNNIPNEIYLTIISMMLQITVW